MKDQPITSQLQMQCYPAFARERANVMEIRRPIGFQHRVLLSVKDARQNERAARLHIARHLGGKLDKRAGKDVGKDEIEGAAIGKDGMVEPCGGHAFNQVVDSIEPHVSGRHFRCDGIDIARQDWYACKLRKRNGQHCAAGAEVERILRLLCGYDTVEHFQAAGRRSVMARSESLSRLDLDADIALLELVTIMSAVDEKPSGTYWLQPFQGFRYPVDVRQHLSFDRPRQRQSGENVSNAVLRLVDVVHGVDRDLVNVARLVQLHHGKRKSLVL